MACGLMYHGSDVLKDGNAGPFSQWTGHPRVLSAGSVPAFNGCVRRRLGKRDASW